MLLKCMKFKKIVKFMALHLTKTGESTIINHNRQIMSRNLYPKRK